MHKLTQLFLLINTLSKAEKRHFKLSTNLQNGKKQYLYLFKKLDECETVDMAYRSFCRKYGKKKAETSARYLYDLLLETLVYLNRETQVQNTIFQQIMKASLLYDRNFIQEALHSLSKAKKLAIKFEQDILLMLIRRTEITYITEAGFGAFTEKELVGKQTRLIESQKVTRSTNMHISLYSTLKYRLSYIDNIRSGKQKEVMNDLILSELNLVSNNYYQGFESLKLHLLFQATYYLNTGSYQSAIRNYTELLSLFDKYEHLKQDPPIYYFTTLTGIIQSLLTAGLYSEIPIFVQKLKELQKADYSKEFLLKVNWNLFYAQANYLLHTGRHQEAEKLCNEYDTVLIKKSASLYKENELDLYLCLVVINLHCQRLKTAQSYIKKIYKESKAFQLYPAFQTARLLKLIIDAELGNQELMDSDIRSIKRSLKNESQAYKTEKVLFKFLSMYPIPMYEKTRNRLWKRLEKDIINIREDKYERQLLNTFDFTRWIESKLTGLPFTEVNLSENEN